VQRKPDLLEIVFTLRSPSRLAGSLNRGKQQGNEQANDGHND
jgi:hypothetical protein